MEMGISGNGNDSMGVKREWKQESHSRTPLLEMDLYELQLGATTMSF